MKILRKKKRINPMRSNIPPKGSIPANVRARPVQRKVAAKPFSASGKPVTKKKPSTDILYKLLEWGQQEEQKCINALRTLAPGISEYDELLEKYELLQQSLEQVKKQLAERK